MISLNSSNFKTEVLEYKGVVLVDFFATWCGPCRMLAPFLEEIDNERSDVKVAKLDIDEAENIASDYDVMSVPTMILFKNGEKISTCVGAASKTRINDWINSHI